ncbi:MAG: zinc finger protein [Rhizobium sp.]|nr:zinc finger protein [Rhizobium sp.]
MTFSWTHHRFTGGSLALDVANSVILRFDDERRTDRFAIAAQRNAFAGAAATLSAERDNFGELAPVASEMASLFIALREAIDAFFRHRVRTGKDDSGMLATLLEAIAATLRRYPDEPSPCPVDLATARSALKLISQPEPDRLKICPNCEWLFVDRSKNRSRNWCDMTVCGNRAKARLHYRKKRKGGPQ